MHADVMWLLTVVLSFPLLTQCDPMYIMSAPQILQVGSEERVLVEAQDYDRTDSIKVHVRVMNFPTKHTDLGNYNLTLDSKNKYQALVNIKIPFNEKVFNVDSDEQQYVYLTASFPGTLLEKIVMVSFQSGHLFVQTDKTIYTPESTVKYRIFAVNSRIKPVNSTVVVKIVTPEGIVVEQKHLTIKKGIVGFEFKLGNPISNGIWKIAANFKENPNKNFTADFEVKEYRLPSFEVNLTPEKSFFYADDEKFSVSIKAKYLFGETVEGSAFVVFGVFDGNNKKSIQSSLNRVDITKGEGKAELKRDQIRQTFPDIKAIIGHTLYISVSVLTESGSEMVEAERRGIHIVTSPYTIHFTRTPKYFKPGMPFHLMLYSNLEVNQNEGYNTVSLVPSPFQYLTKGYQRKGQSYLEYMGSYTEDSKPVYVVNPDETPAKKLELLLTVSDISDSSQGGKTKENGVAMFTVNTKQTETELKITVKTNDEKLQSRTGAQAENSLIAHAYASIPGSKNYLHIDLPTEELMIEKQFSATMHIHTSQTKHEISYMILSKGQIVRTSKLERVDNQVMGEQLSITKDMLPSFRMLAYYHVGNSEVVADSIWVDVKDTCIGKLQVEIDDPHPAYAPSDPIKLKLTASPQSNVYLVAVDKGVYVLNNKNRLTQSKIWDSIEDHDIGCTAGSGKDSMGVFYDAGLLFVSNTQISTADRRETSCAPPKRQRRAITKSQLLNKLVSEYNATMKQCCRDGMVENFLGYTCERRSEYIVDGAECRKAFLNCCQKLADLKKDAVQGELHLARSEEIEVNEQSDEIISRSNFPESWMWDKVEIPNCEANKKCDSVKIDRNLPESITTWSITAVGISDDDGICVADPYEVIVKKDFFVDLKLPYSAAVNEQIEIKAVIHNLQNTPLKKVFVELKENQEICSMASFREKYRTTVSIDPKSSRAVPFVIIPVKAGQFEVEVKAISLNPLRTDGVKKKLKVVTQGVLTTTGEVTLILEPDRYGGQQRSEFKRPFLENQMPDTEAHTYIAVRGRPLAQMINEALSGKGLERLIKQPSGCAEQNLMAMVLPLITTHYLDKTNQWNDVGVDKRAEALNHIKTGYVTELRYCIRDKSFSFNGINGSTWLTAYVVKMFSLAYDLIYLKNDVICDAVNWLITKAQNSDGMFFEVTHATSSAMAGRSSGLTVTSFVLIALQEGHQICRDKIPTLSQHMTKAASYIENNIRNTDDPYAVAMASCALANAGKLDTGLLFNFASSDRSHWPVRENHFFTLEATGYALLALLEVRDFERAKPLVRWLKTNQEFNGGYHSTQSTAVVFQAIAKYMVAKPPSTEGSLSVIVSSTARNTAFKGSFSKMDKSLLRSDKFMANGDLTVTASGKGEGSISVVTLYYARPGENNTKCNKFDLDVKMIRNRTVSYKDAHATYTIVIETRFLDETRNSTMTILDIGMLTGFIVDTDDLKNLVEKKDRYIQSFELNKQLSERGSLIIYLDKVSNQYKERIAFRVHMVLKVGVPQPAAVMVYEYYSKENTCVKFYDPQMQQTSGSIYVLCPTEVCSCAESNCPRLKEPKVPEETERNKAACHNKDFIYKATLEMVTRLGSTDVYTFTIIKVIKEGTDSNVLNDLRDFYAHTLCKDKLGLKEGKDYLIMGPEPKLIGKNHRYTIRTSTWIEYWPTQKESQENKNNNKQRYIGLSSLANLLDEFGCTT